MHYAEHSLNLIFFDAPKHIPQVSELFNNLKNEYTFFGNNTKQLALLGQDSSENK